jgi:hypothetical protein
MKWAGNVARKMGETSAYRFLMGEPEGKRPLGRLSVKWDNNIKTHCYEVGWTGVDWVDSELGQVAGCSEHCNEHKMRGLFLTS